MHRVTTSLFVLGLLLSVHVSGEMEPALASDDELGNEDEALSSVVTVTARKREEDLQEVPFSVAAPTEDQLRDRGAETLEDVSANVAGFSVQNLGPGQSQVAMRGVSAGQIVRDQPGVKEQVGVYLDESVISLSLFTPELDLFDVSRVEILRGPQGTLFGSGSLSGTVRYITNQPELGLSDYLADIAINTIDAGEISGSAKLYANVPLGDRAALRVTGGYTSLGGLHGRGSARFQRQRRRQRRRPHQLAARAAIRAHRGADGNSPPYLSGGQHRRLESDRWLQHPRKSVHDDSAGGEPGRTRTVHPDR